MRARHLAWLVAGFTLTACTVGPNYRTPTVDLPSHWQGLPPPEGPSMPKHDSWWQTFDDPVLNRLMEQADAGNLDVARAMMLLRAARAERDIVAASRYPSVEAKASAAREHESANVPNTAVGLPGETDNLFQVGFDASWEIDLFGAGRRRLEAASAELDAMQADTDAVRTAMLADVARNYIELRGIQAQIALAKQNAEAAQDALALAHSRLASGIGAYADAEGAKADLIIAQGAIEPLEAARELTLNRLAVLLGRNPGNLDIGVERPMPSVPRTMPHELPSELLRRRPDIRAVERRLAAATARVGVAEADWYPRFSLLGDVGLASSAFGDLGNGASRTWSIGPSLSWPILRAGQIAATINVRDAQQKAALISYRQTILAALEDVENGLAAYSHEQALREQLSAAVVANRTRLDLIQSRFAGGLSDFRSVLAARRALIESRQALAHSEVAMAIDWIAICKALGGDWSAAPLATGEGVVVACVTGSTQKGTECIVSR